jgi:hypothetical protein
LPTLPNPYYNLASAPSHGVGIYALLAGVTTPQLAALNPTATTNETTRTLTISGKDFLPPLQVALLGSGHSYPLKVTSISPIAVTAVISAGLEPGEYQVRLTNGDGGTSIAPGRFALYTPSSARFYDFFESGSGKWQRSGEWSIVELPDGQHAMTDSPAGPYQNAASPASTRTTQITSVPFSLDGLDNPVLSFRHDYVLARVGSSQDVGSVELSSDDGASWTTLASYRGGGIYGAGVRRQATSASEWVEVNWKNVTLDLSQFHGTVRLRFRLEVDRAASDKGWLIDDVSVHSGQSGQRFRTYLPVVRR